MELIFKVQEDREAEALFYPVLQDEKSILAVVKSLDYEDQVSVLDRVKRENFKGKKGQLFIVHDENQAVVLIGTGQAKKISMEDWRQAGGQMVNFLRKYSVKTIGLETKYWFKGNNNVTELAQAVAEGFNLANYRFDKYQKKDDDRIEVHPDKLFVYLNSNKRAQFKKGWQTGLLMARGTIEARDLINEPAGNMTPAFLAKRAEQIAKVNKGISVKILDRAAVKKLGMDAFLSIDQGSNQPAKFIHLIYKPIGKAKDRVALVGKGITFDSGGLNTKPWDGMYDMKHDMSGSAVVLGVFSVLAELKPKVEVHGIVAACENMSSGSAIKPGDVVKNMQGKSIEIAHTDAEGRVTLADSLAYAQKQGIKKIVDLATLTGAVISALGKQYAALFANDEKLSKELLNSTKLSGEKLWQLPLAPEYKEHNKSQIADVRNIGKKEAGSITAALFLEEFIEEGTIWSHLDIAGPSYMTEQVNSYNGIGGTGFGVRTLLEWLKSL